MKISNITYLNFRNLENTSIDLSDKINVFYGKNAQGKTSLLEAIYYSSTGISFKTKKTSEMIKYNFDEFISSISYQDYIANNKISVRFKNITGAKKEFFFNKKRISQTDFYGKINIIAYIPEDIILINGSPKNRRDFFDIEISQIDKEYLSNLKNYDKLLKIRNKYLKENKRNSEEFAIYEKEFIKYASYIIFTRIEYVKSLSIILNLQYRKLFNIAQELNLRYETSLDKTAKVTVEMIQESLKKEILQKKYQEDRYKFSLVGPHKDDYKFLLNGHEAKISASQGEKKSIIFSLKLSEIEIIKKNRKENPVVIIDDITSYFDEDRRKSILDFFNKRDIQVLISSTDKLNIEAKNFYVEKGIIEDESNINK
ncbi:DNA replication/repair protein RecF [Fusobacterium polymorphum]|uniref:DNA replication/repair protein RecF n=1 Tax=Fusobacterium nucleatum subsp. polymorphum TaxID=76857 RepID=UPI002923DFEE|nr:DNA replication/repair protein RecF [Fusobacterium nucleatum]BEP07066.1 DNA replication/repair protein RecF [Fusobacterium nucleatum]